MKICWVEQKGIFLPRHWLFFSPFLFPPNKRGKKKRRMNNESRDKKTMPFCSIKSVMITGFLTEKIN